MLALCSTPLALRVGSAARSGRGIVRMNANLPTTADVTDVREWLEEVEGEDALAWVKEQNADAISTFGEPSAQPLYSRILASLESDEKIPYIGRVLNGSADMGAYAAAKPLEAPPVRVAFEYCMRGAPSRLTCPLCVRCGLLSLIRYTRLALTR